MELLSPNSFSRWYWIQSSKIYLGPKLGPFLISGLFRLKTNNWEFSILIIHRLHGLYRWVHLNLYLFPLRPDPAWKIFVSVSEWLNSINYQVLKSKFKNIFHLRPIVRNTGWRIFFDQKSCHRY